MIPETLVNSKHVLRSLRRLYHASKYPYWLEVATLSFARSSKGTKHKYSHCWQRNEIRQHVLYHTEGVEPVFHVDEIGVRGDRLSEYSRPGLFHATETARQQRAVIVAWDWTRLVTRVNLLPDLDKLGVDFVTIKPLMCTRADTHSERTKLALWEKQRQEALGAGNQELGRFLSREFVYRDYLS